ncbi:class I SAM-dependent methyltransferase [Paracoccus sediminis]|uniref:16S rRNA (Guanine1207-N2)-methyltransferase n=1 Tax=Paracoccus sediminis TaxID=1214787 RepID=A0A238WY08_9RHOB|nr:class I SAM-dependent methyltransferase [Paracoccus sediminis]SNR50489.1 16S rRNA (guanine1207-N2)-methyltransferase [Paracoccus sediminis]
MHHGKRIAVTTTRLALALADGPPEGRFLVVGARGGDDLAPLDPARTDIQQGNFPDHRALSARGFSVAPLAQGRFDAALVILPRAKAAARAWIADAAGRLSPGAALWIDGQKTDGVDSLLRDLRGLGPVDEVHSKAHGKIFRVTVPSGNWLPADWSAHPHHVAPDFVTRPGVFSADGIDPGSALLASALPDRMPTRIVDLGAGWGWLASQALDRPGVEVIHLVEADHAALESARDNIRDPRAQFHWADVRDFALSQPVNGAIMNPPFHDGRAADPRIGGDFIAAAARLLTGAGRLWMVANRHLPYESALEQHFAHVREVAGNSRFKVFEATGANRGAARKGRR